MDRKSVGDDQVFLTTILGHVDDIAPQWLSTALDAEICSADIHNVLGGTAMKALLELTYGTAPPRHALYEGGSRRSRRAAGTGRHLRGCGPFYGEEMGAKAAFGRRLNFGAHRDSDEYRAISLANLSMPTVRFVDALSPLTVFEAAFALENFASCTRADGTVPA
jgi:hypothetical protein